MAKIQLRPARPEDFSSVYEMICELEDENLDTSAFEKIYNRNLGDERVHYIVAEADNCTVGFISLHIQNLLHHNGRVAEIQELFVRNGMRGRGIGKRLVDRARHVAIERHCKVFEVTCNIKREDTHRFYMREGLARTHYKFTENIG